MERMDQNDMLCADQNLWGLAALSVGHFFLVSRKFQSFLLYVYFNSEDNTSSPNC